MKLDLDIEQFWKDEDRSHDDNCFAKSNPQVALGIRMSDECVFAELGEEGQPWGYTDPQRRYELNCRYNEKARKIVGRALLAENKPLPPEKQPKVTIPGYRPIGEVFGGQYVFDGTTTWLKGTMNDADDLAKKLKEVRALTEDTLIVIEASLDTDFSYLSGLGFQLIKEKKYKTNKHVFIQKI